MVGVNIPLSVESGSSIIMYFFIFSICDRFSFAFFTALETSLFYSSSLMFFEISGSTTIRATK